MEIFDPRKLNGVKLNNSIRV